MSHNPFQPQNCLSLQQQSILHKSHAMSPGPPEHPRWHYLCWLQFISSWCHTCPYTMIPQACNKAKMQVLAFSQTIRSIFVHLLVPLPSVSGEARDQTLKFPSHFVKIRSYALHVTTDVKGTTNDIFSAGIVLTLQPAMLSVYSITLNILHKTIHQCTLCLRHCQHSIVM